MDQAGERHSWRAWITPVFAYWGWWHFAQDRIGAAAESAGKVAAVVAASVVAGKILGHLGEAGAYAGFWRARSRPMPFLGLWLAIASISMLDLLALAISSRAGDSAAWWQVALAGRSAAGTGPGGTGGLGVAFGSFGLLTVARLVLTGASMSRFARVRFVGPFALCCCTWIVTRLAHGWVLDLVRGRSPLPG